MTENNNPQHGNAVREPEAGARAEMHAATASIESPASAPAEAGSEPAASEGSPLGAYRRARLNPTVDLDQAKSIPSIRPQEPPPASAPSAATEPAPAGPQTAHSEAVESSQTTDAPVEAAPERRSSPPIEVPPPIKDLDATLEAEIEAAMASGELEAAAVTPALTEEAVEAGAKPPEDQLEAGQHLTGKIQSIHSDSVFFDLGYRSPGVIPLRQFVSGKKPEVGQLLEVLVDRISHEEGLIYLNLPKGVRRIAGNWESLAKGQIVDCLVNRTNKGGLEVTVSGLRAFLPSSQVELGFISDLTPYVGQKLRVEVMEVNPRKRNLVVSRRAFLQIERKEVEEKFWETVAVEQTYTGKIKTIKDYGAFVDLGGTDRKSVV